MAENESQKRWIRKPNMLVISLYILTSITSTKGTTSVSIEFGNKSVDHWEFAFGANSKEFLYDFCKYNGTSEGTQCKNFVPKTSVDFEKVCGCTIQHNGTITDGSFSFDLSCKSDLSYCPGELTLIYRQGSNARAPPQVPIHQGIGKNNSKSTGIPLESANEADPDVATNRNNWLLVVSIISFVVNVLLVITIILCLTNEKVHAFLKPKRSQLCSGSNCSRVMDREREVNDVDSPEKGLLKIPRDSENID